MQGITFKSLSLVMEKTSGEVSSLPLSVNREVSEDVVISNLATSETEESGNEPELKFVAERLVPLKNNDNNLPDPAHTYKETDHTISSASTVTDCDSNTQDKKRGKKIIPVWMVFRFASCLDLIMIFAGFFLSIASGLALPIQILLFGEMVDIFLYHNIATSIVANTSIATFVQSSATLLNMSCNVTAVLEQQPSLFEAIGNSSTLLCESENQRIFEDIINFACEPDSQLRSEVARFSLYFVILASVTLVATFLGTLFWNASAYQQTRQIRQAFYYSILYQEIGWFDVTKTNEFITRLVDDVEKIQAGIGDKLSRFINHLATFIGGFAIAFILSWKMALVVFIMLPIIMVEGTLISKAVVTFAAKEQSAYAAAGAIAQEVISSIRTVVAFGGEDRELERYNVHLLKARRQGLRKWFFSSLVISLFYFTLYCTFALGFWYGSTLLLDCEISTGNIVTVFFCLTFGSYYLGDSLPELETFTTALASATTIFQVIDRQSLFDTSSQEGSVLDKMEGNINFNNVTFSYPARTGVQVLRGLDLDIKCGQRIALVGPSGCGKSTVIQLIQRFYDADGGQITVDGHDIGSLNLKWLRSQIGVVSQEPVLFDTTIAENIRHGREEASMEDIQEVAKKANAHDFISQLPDGYDTYVGEGGAQLSGGQKQRIAIARALIRDPKVLLLDEATSALDTESEKVVQDALDKAREGRTTIVIAHRLSTIQNVDVIISLEDGRVAERGTHTELMERRGLYYDLVTAQTIVEEEESSEAMTDLTDFKAAIRKASVSRQSSVSSKVSQSKAFRSIYRRGTSLHYDGKFFQYSNSKRRKRISLHSLPDGPWSSEGHPVHLPVQHVYSNSSTDHPPLSRYNSSIGEAANMIWEEEEQEHDSVFSTDVPACNEVTEVSTLRLRATTLSRLLQGRSKKVEEDLPMRKIPFKELLKLNKPDWPLVLAGVLLLLFVGAVFPVLSVIFTNVLRAFGLLNREDIEEGIKSVSFGFIGLAVFAGLVFFSGYYALAIAGERLTTRLRYKSFQAMLRQEVGWFEQSLNSTGALTTRLASDAGEVQGITGIRLGIILRVTSSIISAVVVSLIASWELTLLLVLIFPILFMVGISEVQLLKGLAKKNKKRLEESSQTAVESIANIRTVVGLGAEENFFSKYRNLLASPFKDSIKSILVQAVVISVTRSLVFYLYAAGYNLGAFLVVDGRAVYYEIFQVFTSIMFTALLLGRALTDAPDAAKAKVAASRIFGLLEREPKITACNSGEKNISEVTKADIAVKSVHFNYPARPDVQVLQGLDISVKPGQTLALVGPSGCGKSTVVALVERFYDPVQGSLTLEGVDLRDLNLKWLRTQIGIVSQEPVLFDDTVAENIRYGALFRDVSDDEIVEAAKSANIHSFIQSLPEGYNTNVGAKGTQLSGGQKQRIAIARALVRDPKVLLLDEATSALDTESEKVVQDALDKAREGRTTIVIAHRLSTIYNSDVIAVIHNGRVIESGTHSELMALQGAYYLLNTVQMQEDYSSALSTVTST